jgi:hypothetical protein
MPQTQQNVELTEVWQCTLQWRRNGWVNRRENKDDGGLGPPKREATMLLTMNRPQNISQGPALIENADT